jgi:hypothetical protein
MALPTKIEPVATLRWGKTPAPISGQHFAYLFQLTALLLQPTIHQI